MFCFRRHFAYRISVVVLSPCQKSGRRLEAGENASANWLTCEFPAILLRSFGKKRAARASRLFSVARWSLCEAPLKCTDEAGNMPIANDVGNFFHAHMAVREKVSCSLKLLFVQPLSHGNTSLVLEQSLEVRGAQTEFEGQIADGERCSGLNHLHDPLYALIQNRGPQWGGHCAASMRQA